MTTADWMEEWDPVIETIGKDYLDGEITWGADPIEPGAVRRYLEPLEFDCRLHTDPEVARAAGYTDVIMPYTGVLVWTIPPAWTPGETLFDSVDRNAQPVHSKINNADMPVGPRTTGFFGTDIEVHFHREAVARERIGRRGKTLLSCVPKETGVGLGAFMNWQSDLITETGEVIGFIRIGTYAYVPKDEVAA